jgi:hypothetical protein
MAPRYNNRNNGRGAKCPPGVFCLTPGVLLSGALFIGAIVAIIWYINKTRPVFVMPQQHHEAPHTNVQVNTDERYSIAPRPERLWRTGYEIPPAAYGTRIPIGISTQGLPQQYQSMGILKTSGGQMLPLYGRRTISRSDRFQYYTRSDTANPIPLPIRYKRHDCQDDIGCEELFSGESVKIVPTNEEAMATIYRFDGPTYVPGLV